MAEMADGMADGIVEWRNGGMAEWRKWRPNGGMGYIPTFMVHADDDTDTFKSYSIDICLFNLKINPILCFSNIKTQSRSNPPPVMRYGYVRT